MPLLAKRLLLASSIVSCCLGMDGSTNKLTPRGSAAARFTIRQA